VKAVAETLGVSRSNLVEQLAEGGKPRRRHHKAQDAAVLPLVRRLVDARPTYGYRLITAMHRACRQFLPGGFGIRSLRPIRWIALERNG
jgi:hypothetical protein